MPASGAPRRTAAWVGTLCLHGKFGHRATSAPSHGALDGGAGLLVVDGLLQQRRAGEIRIRRGTTCVMPETGADVFFDNVGGTVLDAMLPLMGHHGRIVCCGAAAQYDDKEDAVLQPGPRGIPQHLFNKALRMEGIFTPDYASEWAEGARQPGHRQSRDEWPPTRGDTRV